MQLTQSDLIARGWTKTLIERYLGDPDALKTNPNYKSGPPMRLFAVSRVEETETRIRPEFEKVIALRERRSRSALQAAQRNRDTLGEWARTVKIELPRTKPDKLIKEAIEHYNERQIERDRDRTASLGDSWEFLRRITCNYVRHCLTDYEKQLDDIGGKVGNKKAYQILRNRLNRAIKKQYGF